MEKLFSVHTTAKMFGETRAYSVADAPAVKGKFPIVIFSHGFPVYPQQNTVQMEEWASHGYIVIAVAHLYDTSDLRLADGRLVPSLGQPVGSPEYKVVKQQLCCGATHDIRMGALKDYPRVFHPTHQGQVEKAWQNDELFLANALKTGAVPDDIKPVLANGDLNRLALTGMSYGGNTAADTCRLIDTCKAAINLDGSNYDPGLFNADVGRPFLLVMSDWVRLPLEGRSNDPTFAFNDYAYEPWISAGMNKDVVRVRVDHTRHLGLTDLLLLLNDPDKEKAVGDADPRPTLAAINGVTLAFLNEYLKGGSRDAVEKSIDGSPLLHRHDPSSVRDWARSRKTP
jgi:predicted dienelactone hydrolase